MFHNQGDAESWCEVFCASQLIFEDFEEFEHPGCYPFPSVTLSGADEGGTDEGGGGVCADWDPALHVSWSGGVYLVDKAFVAGLVADPTPLTTCDDAGFQENAPGTGFAVFNANRGELLYELGLRNGDVPLTVNGYPLDTYSDVLVAFSSLYGQTFTFVIEVQRGSNIVVLEHGMS